MGDDLHSLAMRCWVLVGLVLMTVVSRTDATGCVEADLCCPGKNVTCWADGPRPSDKKGSQCFCDEACLELGDCCLDYRAHCKSVSCVVSPKWEAWSACDVRCGEGVQTRNRKILVHPSNGGAPCDITIERRKCEGSNCKVIRAPEGNEELKETGKIVPASYATWRTSNVYSPYEDIRQNLFKQMKYADLLKDKKPAYCAKYEIVETRRACHSNKTESWAKKLTVGTKLCVECQHFAMSKEGGSRCTGHGVYQRDTLWNAVTVPRCHGKWVMTTRHDEPCNCDPYSETSFIFV